jgi:hypothetical protein
VATFFYAVERCGGVRGGGHDEFIACRAWYLAAWSDEQAGWRGEESRVRRRSARIYNAAFYGWWREATEVKARLYRGEAWAGVEVRLSFNNMRSSVQYRMRSGSQKPKVARRGTRSRAVADVIGKSRSPRLSLHVMLP